MTRIERSVPSLLQGMSAQPPYLRSESQAGYQLNAVSDIQRGLMKRPGTRHISNLSGLTSNEKAFVHWIDRDDTEQYVATFDGDSLQVRSLDGTDHPVYDTGNALSYLSSDNPFTALVAETIGDTTIIVNRNRIPRMSSTLSAAQDNLAVVFVKQGEYGQDYSITIEGPTIGAKTVTHTTSTTDVTKLQTSAIATELKTLLEALTDWATDFTITHTEGDSWFYIERTDSSDFDISVRDSVRNGILGLCYQAVQDFDELPPIAPDGLVVKVLGKLTEDADDYYVSFDSLRDTGDGDAAGAWVETVAPGIEKSFNAATMPHRLVRLQDDSDGTNTGTPFKPYFTLSPLVWEDRSAGDTTTVPDPSFIGRNIENIFTSNNRLGFIAEDRIIMSATGDLFRFWRKTVLTVPDDDPIDVAVNSGSVLNLLHAVPFGDVIVFAGDESQYIAPVDEASSPNTFRIEQSSNLPTERFCAPQVVERSLFLPGSTTNHTIVNEVRSAGDRRLFDADEVSIQMGSLIRGSALKMSASRVYSSTFTSVDGEGWTSALFVNRWYVQGNQKIQNSWGVWSFLHKIVSHEVINEKLYMVVLRPEGLTLEVVELEPEFVDFNLLHPVHLDRLIFSAPVPVNPEPDNDADSDPSSGLPGYQVDGNDSSGRASASDSPAGGGTIVSPSSNVGRPTPIGDGGDPDEDSEVVAGGSGVPFVGWTSSGSNSITLSTPPPQSAESLIVTYDEATDRTNIRLPFRPRMMGDTVKTIILRADTTEVIPWVDGLDEYSVRMPGDYRGVSLYIGNTYEFMYTFNQPRMIQNTSGGPGPIHGGRLQIMKWYFNYLRSGPFRVSVLDRTRYVANRLVTPRKVGTALNLVGSGQHGESIRRNADNIQVQLRSVNHLPTQIVSSSWVGEYSNPSGA